MIDDASKIYWDVRPSSHFETLEFRVADVCMTIDEAVMIAGLCRALARTCHAQYRRGEPVEPIRPELLRAAKWRASRFGLEGELIDVRRPPVRPRGRADRRAAGLPPPRARGGRRMGRGRGPGPADRSAAATGPQRQRDGLRAVGPARGRRRPDRRGDPAGSTDWVRKTSLHGTARSRPAMAHLPPLPAIAEIRADLPGKTSATSRPGARAPRPGPGRAGPASASLREIIGS